MGRLDGKVAIILGAAGKDNMGQVIARRFRDEGAKVVVAGRKEAPLKALAEELGGSYALCDITRKADVDAMFKHAVDTYGKVDIAINSTGWGLLASFKDTTEKLLDDMLAIQFKGPYYFIQACLDHMGKGGSIIQISSATATIMLDNHSAYMGAKAGIDHVIRCAAYEHGHRGIRANSVSPGLTQTPMTADAMQSPSLVEAFRKEYPLGRIGTKEDIAAACVWLGSDECFMTGENLQVNGGLTLRRNPTAEELNAAFVKDGIAPRD